MKLTHRSIITETLDTCRKTGIVEAFKSFFDRVGFHNYITLNCPVLNYSFIVRSAHVSFWKTFEAGKWEYENLSFLRNLITEGDTVLDVGAWIGAYTLFFSRLVGRSGRVFSFEPNPETYKILLDNIRMNNVSNIIVEKKGIMDKNKVLNMWSSIESSSCSVFPTYFIKRKLKDVYVFKTKCTTIDDYVFKHRLEPDLVKIE